MESSIIKADSYQRFMEHELTIIDKDRVEVPFVLNRAQAHFLHNLGSLNNVLKNRKQGISSVSLAIAVIKFLTGENERCVSVSFIESSAQQQLQRAKHFIQSYERLNDVKVPLKYNSKQEMVFEGVTSDGRKFTNTLRVGSAKSKSFGRGDDITFLHITEAAFADDLQALLSGIGEAVTHNAITILETTADGFNQFKEHWDNTELGNNGYKNFFYDPFWTYTKEFVEAKRKNLGRLGPQEYPYTAKEAFLTTGAHFFDVEAMKLYDERTRDPIATPQGIDKDMFSFYRPLKRGEFIIVFIDTAGEGSDRNGGQFLSKDSLDLPIELFYEGSIVDVTPKLKTLLEYIYEQTGVPPYVSYETNNGGGYELERLERLNTLQHYAVAKQFKLNTEGVLEETDKLGWNTNTATRPVMIQGVEDLVNNQLVTIYSSRTVNEMFSFIKKKTISGWKAQAESHSHDDLIMSLAGVWQMYPIAKAPPDPNHLHAYTPSWVNQ